MNESRSLLVVMIIYVYIIFFKLLYIQSVPALSNGSHKAIFDSNDFKMLKCSLKRLLLFTTDTVNYTEHRPSSYQS